MINYYDILGVSQHADISEIKAAFRRLAKQYHPDRNPNGKDFFERVLIAYETLADPASKAAYDSRLKQPSPAQRRADIQKPAGKNWKFDERELKRRQYYNEHIRRYARETASYNAQAEGKKSYNEYKYILFATPLAVALFVMIMKLTGPMSPQAKHGNGPDHAVFRQTESELRPGDAPYNFIFGNPHYDLTSNRTLVIRNETGLDAIVCIFSSAKFLRSFFIQPGFSAEVAQLPRKPLEIRYCTGLAFNYRRQLRESNVEGGFTRDASYFHSISSLVPATRSELSLTPGISEGFVQTSEKEFFTLPR